MINPNDERPTLPKISPPPREPRAWDYPVHSNFIPLHQTPVYNIAQVESTDDDKLSSQFQMPEESRVHHFLRSLLRDNELGDLLDN